MTNLDDDRVLRQHLGAEVRRLRKAAGLTQRELGDLAGYSRVYVTLVETGRDRPGQDFLRRLSNVLDAGDTLLELYRGLRFASDAVQEDIQNRESDDDVNRRDILRGMGAMALQAKVFAPPVAASTASQAFNVASLDHFRQLREVLIDSDNLFGSKQVIPTVYRQIELLQRLRRGTRGPDRQAALHVQAQFAEFAAWLHQDQSEHELARSCTDRALEWAHATRDPGLITFILSRKSQLAGDMQDALTAIDVAEAAADVAPPNTRLQAIATTYAAHGHALAGDGATSARMYERAHELLDTTDIDPRSTWGVWLDASYIEAQRARSSVVLGEYDAAVQGFNRAIADLPHGYPRDRGVYLARAALAHAGARDTSQAVELGLQALAIGAETQSGRITTALRRLDELLSTQNSPEASEFRDAMRSNHVA